MKMGLVRKWTSFKFSPFFPGSLRELECFLRLPVPENFSQRIQINISSTIFIMIITMIITAAFSKQLFANKWKVSLLDSSGTSFLSFHKDRRYFRWHGDARSRFHWMASFWQSPSSPTHTHTHTRWHVDLRGNHLPKWAQGNSPSGGTSGIWWYVWQLVGSGSTVPTSWEKLLKSKSIYNSITALYNVCLKWRCGNFSRVVVFSSLQKRCGKVKLSARFFLFVPVRQSKGALERKIYLYLLDFVLSLHHYFKPIIIMLYFFNQIRFHTNIYPN